MRKYDLVIVGGGLVGSALALALRGSGLKVALVEAVSRSADSHPSYDDRTLALALASVRLIKKLGLWDALSSKVTAIQRIVVSASKQLVRTRLESKEQHLPEFGHVVYAKDLGLAMQSALEHEEDIKSFCPSEVTGFEYKAESAHVFLTHGNGEQETISCKLIVGADGADSFIRQQLGLKAQQFDYQRSAIITNVTPEKPHQNTAYEHLTETGPMALLPITQNRCGLVWVTKTEHQQTLLDMSDEQFIQKAQKRLSYPLGRITRCGKRFAYPLRLSYAREQIAERALLMGNAAHAIAPVSAQGFNLGLRDAMQLAQLLLDEAPGSDIGDMAILQKYQDLRREDQSNIVQWTDTLMRAFSNPSSMVKYARAGVMLGINLSGTARKKVTHLAMGL